MKRFTSILLTAGLLLGGVNIPVAAEETASNLLINGGFEDSIYGDSAAWNQNISNWDVLSLDNKTDQVKEGSNSLHYYSTAAGSFSLYQAVSLEAGTYTLSGYGSGSSTTLTFYAGSEQSQGTALSGWGNWDQGSLTFTLSEAGSVNVGFTVAYEAEGWADIDDLTLVKKSDTEGGNTEGGNTEGGNTEGGNTEGGNTEDESTDQGYLINPGFETDIWADSGSVWNPAAATWDKGDSTDDIWIGCQDVTNYKRSGNQSLKFYTPVENTFTISQKVTLAAGSYNFGGYVSGGDCQPVFNVSSQDAGCEVTLTGWNTWDEGYVDFTLEEETELTVSLTLVCQADGWGYVDDMYLKDGAHEEIFTPGEKVNVDPIEGLSEDFIRGVDISTVLSMENAGIVYKNQDGEVEDIFSILKNSGVNYVRVKVFNDPYDAEGHGYGGGNNDLKTAIEIGKRASAYGLKMMVDFHYSDFWAQPNNQQKPKAWADYDLEETKDALYSFTKDSLQALKDAGVDVGMVQIGNETSQNICEYTDWDDICTLFGAGIQAAREVDENILTVIHFGGSAKGEYLNYMKEMADRDLDYDVLGVSWYPFYNHGTIENLHKYLNEAAATYNKKVIVAENSYATTFDDSDGQANTFGDDSYIKRQANLSQWPISMQGQAQEVRDTIEAISTVDNGMGIGYFYWEPAWITVGDTSNLTGDAWEAQYAANQEKWNTYGCGWASQYASGYYTTRTTVEKYWGGSNWDNQAMFDVKGVATDALNVFKYIYSGSEGSSIVKPDSLASGADKTVNLQDKLDSDGIWKAIWQDQFSCLMSDGSSRDINVRRYVTSDVDKLIAAYEKGSVGSHTVHVILMDSQNTVMPITVSIKGNASAIKSAKLSASSYTYDGKVKTPAVTLYNTSGVKLTKDTDYTLSYASGRKYPGSYKVTIKGKGFYSFTKTLSFKINVTTTKTSIKKLTAGKKAFTVTNSKVKTATGYQIQYALNNKFKSATLKTYKGIATVKHTIKKLKKKKVYYVRVRTYRTINKKNYYSAWSAVKKIKTK